jgi:hypothetical protein
MEGAESYQVVIRAHPSDEQIESGIIQTNEWTPGGELKPGVTYSWVVMANRGGQRVYVPSAGSAGAYFVVVSKQRLAEIEEAKRKSNGSHLLMAVLYAREGLLSEANGELKALERENPEFSLVKRLRRSLGSSLKK